MAYAQRVGTITNFKEEGRFISFEVVPPGKDKGNKCKAFATKDKDSNEPSEIALKLRAFTNADNAKNWRVGGKEDFVHGNNGHSWRSFTAYKIEEALPTDDQIFTMDRDGNPLDASTQGTKAAPVASGGNATADEWAPYICAAAEILAKEGGSQALTPVKVSDLATILVAARDALAHDFRQGGESSEAASEPVPF